MSGVVKGIASAMESRPPFSGNNQMSRTRTKRKEAKRKPNKDQHKELISIDISVRWPATGFLHSEWHCENAHFICCFVTLLLGPD